MMRTAREVYRAHDVLKAIVLNEVPNPFEGALEIASMVSALDVLCWVLRHDHNNSFETNLAKATHFLDNLGYSLVAVDAPEDDLPGDGPKERSH
jgi:hypothetical protein